MRFPDTAHVFGGSLLASSISQEELVLRYLAAITKPHWALREPNYATEGVVLSITIATHLASRYDELDENAGFTD